MAIRKSHLMLEKSNPINSMMKPIVACGTSFIRMTIPSFPLHEAERIPDGLRFVRRYPYASPVDLFRFYPRVLYKLY
jgi:hypothetical protein